MWDHQQESNIYREKKEKQITIQWYQGKMYQKRQIKIICKEQLNKIWLN